MSRKRTSSSSTAPAPPTKPPEPAGTRQDATRSRPTHDAPLGMNSQAKPKAAEQGRDKAGRWRR